MQVLSFDQLGTSLQSGSACHSCCMFFRWPGTDSLCGAMTVHTGDTDLFLAEDDFVPVDEGVGCYECA